MFFGIIFFGWIVDILDHVASLDTDPPTSGCLFSDLAGLFSDVYFPLQCDAFDVAPQRVRPWACAQSPWEDSGLNRALSLPDLSVKLSASAGITPSC